MSTDRPPHDAHARDDAAELRPSLPGTELESAERAIAVMIAVANTLTHWDSFEHASERLLRDLAGALGLAGGALWLPAGEVLVARAIWTAQSVDRTALERALNPLPLGGSLPGSAWKRREPVFRPIPAPADGFGAHSLHAQLAVPAWTGAEVLGVIELYSAANAALTGRLMEVLGIAGHVLGTLFASRRGELKLSPLTARELEVLTLAAHGLTGRGIAEELEISPATVKTHFEHIFRKLGVSDRTAAVAHGLRGGLIR
jgi:DNA-binding CsgD family transcriptional regulator